MNINDCLSEFQFRGSRISRCIIENSFISLPNVDDLDTSLGINNGISNIIKDGSGALLAKVLLELNATYKTKDEIDDEKKRINIQFCIEGMFRYSKDDENTFKQMLILNGTSMLYSIARSNIATLTSMSLDRGKISLPMINFVKVFEAKRKEENEKLENTSGET